MGVELQGEDEILRDRITVDSPGEDGTAEIDGEDSRADVAERAAEAERARVAENAEMLDGMTLDELDEKIDGVVDQLNEHIADPDPHPATGATVGETRRSADDEAGGTGGTSYEITCPEGYVATGIQGGAGRVVDSITVLCSPLD